MSRVAVKPYLITKNPEGAISIAVRTTRLNSQGYPLVSSETLEQSFRTATLARSFLRETYGAEPGDIAIK
ncbi:hypothetical protein [Sphingomonas crusticola]|uniref:hypothetical protein n=1 Tax=Sphingomonas crusticola TaxID=1697973 RepID=UPI000E25F15D|nr:hypothetical protein [Sphingomonas crusticola]